MAGSMTGLLPGDVLEAEEVGFAGDRGEGELGEAAFVGAEAESGCGSGGIDEEGASWIDGDGLAGERGLGTGYGLAGGAGQAGQGGVVAGDDLDGVLASGTEEEIVVGVVGGGGRSSVAVEDDSAENSAQVEIGATVQREFEDAAAVDGVAREDGVADDAGLAAAGEAEGDVAEVGGAAGGDFDVGPGFGGEAGGADSQGVQAGAEVGDSAEAETGATALGGWEVGIGTLDGEDGVFDGCAGGINDAEGEGGRSGEGGGEEGGRECGADAHGSMIGQVRRASDGVRIGRRREGDDGRVWRE